MTFDGQEIDFVDREFEFNSKEIGFDGLIPFFYLTVFTHKYGLDPNFLLPEMN
jgi:hypothetical protein